MSHNIKVVLAKNYIDNLSEETRKGMLEKARQGLWPSFAPLGYENDRQSGRIVIDWPRARIIRKLFETYATGQSSLRDLVTLAKQEGLRSRKGNEVQKAAVAVILRSPIYIGDFRWDGEYFRGRHEPIVTRELFARVETILNDRNRPRRQTREFAFRGFLKCGHCGCTITVQETKGHVYYLCTKNRGPCPQKTIREEDLARQLAEPLKRLRMTPDRAEWVLEAIRQSTQTERDRRAEETAQLERESADLERRVDVLYEDRLRGVISDVFWKRKHDECGERQSAIRLELERLEEAEGQEVSTAEEVIKLSQEAHSLYLAQDAFEQRKLADLLYSNPVLVDGVVEADLAQPFDQIADAVQKESRLRERSLPRSLTDRIWLPKRNSSRRRSPGWAKPEVWFRIVHIAQEGADRAPVATYREQTVEIALGPKGAFQTGIVGALKRRVAPGQTVNALSAKARNRKPPKEPQTPRVVEHLRQAIQWKARLESGDIQNQSAIAIQEGITRARVAQIMGLLRLAPGIQEQILSLPDSVGRPILTERALRPIAQIDCPSAQRARFFALLQQSE